MSHWPTAGAFGRLGIRPAGPRTRDGVSAALGWRSLPAAAQLYTALVVVVGVALFVVFFPRTLPQPILFATLLVFACLTSAWKVNLPLPLASGVTLSVSYAACLMSLLLLGPEQAVVIAAAGVLTQCTYKAKQPYPLYRTVFSVAAAVATMAATSVVFVWLGGVAAEPLDSFGSAKPIVGAIGTYFVLNTTLIAGAIALTTGDTFVSTWRRDFLWLGASFMVAGGAGAFASVLIAGGLHWKAVLLAAPVYLTYRTYQLFVGRLEDQKRHVKESQRLHQETVTALGQAREAERALEAEGERLAAALADMTRLEETRKQLLEREQVARASAEDANRLKDQFLAIVSHELRTPLNAILGWSDMLQRGTLEGAMRERACRTIFTSAQRQAELIEDLLDVARITSGKLRLDRTLVDVRDVVRDALQLVQPGVSRKNICVTLDAHPACLPVYGDPARLQQIASNLLSNAVKFTPEGGAVLVVVRPNGAALELVVTDTGQGISAEFLPSVFEPFRQADESTTRVHSGLGLGLSIVQNLVDAHGGTVNVESEGEGRGTTFTVRLPVAVGVQASAASGPGGFTAFDDGDPLDLLEGISVLVVDDDEPTREMITAQLHARRATVLTAASAGCAFEVLERSHVDVLLADIGMPEEDGYSLIRRLRAVESPRLASLPAAALTAFSREQDRQQALGAGYNLHLAKPVDARSLAAAILTLHGSRPPDQEASHPTISAPPPRRTNEHTYPSVRSARQAV